MKQKYLIITSGENASDTGILFLKAESHEDALMTFLINTGKVAADEDMVPEDKENLYDDINRMLNEFPIGVAEISGDAENPEIEWFYELP